MSPNYQVFINNCYGWKSHSIDDYTFWFKGYLLESSTEDLFLKSIDLLKIQKPHHNQLSNFCNEVRGHFSLIIICKDTVFCFVDKVRSIPLFYFKHFGKMLISNHTDDFKHYINAAEINHEVCLEIAMSGYAMNENAIFKNLKQLNAGEYLYIKGTQIKIENYYRYSPWKSENRKDKDLKRELTNITKSVLQDMVESCKDRQIAILLSAGNDSRLIASGLRELNVNNVVCFSYGSKKSFEVTTAKKIANKLSYQWFHIPISLSSQKVSFKEDSFFEYWSFSDTLTNSPILMDYSVIKSISNSNYLSKDAIFVNGNTGDFITGGHIIHSPSEKNLDTLESLLEKYINKHYSLWSCLKTSANKKIIKEGLKKLVHEVIQEESITENDYWALFESIEWSGRQSKYVTSVQRSYEFFGYEWRLPLWDPKYVDFWESVPQEYKLEQLLYKEWLFENNWGGVWRDIKVNEFKLPKSKVLLFRLIFKAFFIILGKDKWHSFDQRVFWYFLDNTGSTAIESYKNVLLDRCGARNRNAWIVKKHLKNHNINFESFYEN